MSLPAFPNVTTQIELNNNDVDLDDLKSSILSNKLIMLKWIQTTENQLKDEIKKTKNIILTESKKEINYVDEILKEKLKLNDSNVKRCQFKDEQNNQEQCKRINLPYSNYCNKHISHNKDQQLFKRCSIKLKNNKQCPNSSLTIFNDKEICLKHSNDLKNSENIENNNLDINLINDFKEITKTKRKTNKSGNLNDNKPKKTRKKKDNQQTTIKNNLTTITNLNELSSSNNLINNSTYTCYSTNNNNFNDFNSTTINTTDLIENYIPCLTNNNENLNQLSNLNHSEDSLVAIVNNNDDLPFEENELCDLNLILDKIPDDAFNDIFMENLSADCANISFNNSNDDVNNLEPSISLNFKNSTTSTDCFRENINERTNVNNNLQLNNNLLFNQNHLELNNDLNQTDMMYLQNNLITTNEPIKSINHFSNNLCTINNNINGTNIQQSNYNNSFNFLDYKTVQQQQNLPQQQQYSSQLISHQNYSTTNSTTPPNYNSATFLQSNYSSSNGHLINNNNNNNFQTTNSSSNNLLNDEQNGYTGNNINNLITNQSFTNNNQSTINKTELQDKKFNLFQENCKTNYSTTYSNIYDDLPPFETINQSNNNRLNGTSSLPSFSMINMIKKGIKN